MKTLTFTIIISLSILHTSMAQNSWNIRANAGFASGNSFIDGYYFSFDLGIPLAKSLELAPTFTGMSSLPNSFIYNSWDKTAGISYGVDDSGPRQEQEYGDNLISISLLIQFNPFHLIENNKLKKHELIIGTGISYNSYTMISSRYEINNGEYELTNFSLKSDRNISPYYIKLSYNYLLKENLFLGVVGSLPGFDGEAVFLGGIQFGVKF